MLEDKRLLFVFYRTSSGNEPVRDWLKKLDPEDRKTVGVDLKKIEYGYPIGMPVCRHLGQDLLECRSDITHNRIARVIFCIDGDKMIGLNGFIKKTQRTPRAEIDLALTRKREAGL